jgi:sugar lactone lactonase YvrE
MRQILLAAVIALTVVACRQAPKEEIPSESIAKDSVQPPPVKLTLKWETDSLLTTNESALYDKERDVIYVANINGTPDAKDNNGFISKLSTDGKITELKWITKLHAPKGLGLAGNKLYVADIDRVVEIDVVKGKISKTYPVEGAKFLNDVTVDSAGVVYISDTGAGNVMRLENGKLTKYLENVDGPNGLLAEDSRLMVLTWNGKTVNTVDPSNKQITIQADSIENLDGIESMGDGAYLLSSWNGMIHYLDKDWKNVMVLDLRGDSINSADIEYIKEKNLLLVPTFFHNTVRAYEVSR